MTGGAKPAKNSEKRRPVVSVVSPRKALGRKSFSPCLPPALPSLRTANHRKPHTTHKTERPRHASRPGTGVSLERLGQRCPHGHRPGLPLRALLHHHHGPPGTAGGDIHDTQRPGSWTLQRDSRQYGHTIFLSDNQNLHPAGSTKTSTSKARSTQLSSKAGRTSENLHLESRIYEAPHTAGSTKLFTWIARSKVLQPASSSSSSSSYSSASCRLHPVWQWKIMSSGRSRISSAVLSPSS